MKDLLSEFHKIQLFLLEDTLNYSLVPGMLLSLSPLNLLVSQATRSSGLGNRHLDHYNSFKKPLSKYYGSKFKDMKGYIRSKNSAT